MSGTVGMTVHNRAAEAFPYTAYIVRTENKHRLKKAGLFFGQSLIRTVECTEFASSVRNHFKAVPNAAGKRTIWRKTTWQQQMART